MKRSQEGFLLRLPQKLTLETVPSLFSTISSQSPQTQGSLKAEEVETIDSSGAALLRWVKRTYPRLSLEGLNPDQARALELFPSPPPLQHALSSKPFTYRGAIEGLGGHLVKGWEGFVRLITLGSDTFYYLLEYPFRRRGLHRGDTVQQLFSMGYNSFPIVTLIAVLVGITISLTSAAQLKIFGAELYLADLVGIAMVKELVPLITCIILAGKVGASLTAALATMSVMEEIDALKTMGITPVRFLMLPRLFAITLAMPLLITIADFVGILACTAVGYFYSNIPPRAFIKELFTVVFLSDYAIGLIKGWVFGWTVVICSGHKGFQAHGGAEEVGKATTEAVVLSLALIILLDCIFAFLLYF